MCSSDLFLLGNFGVARFMIGDMLLGFIRLGLTILYYIFIALSFNNNTEYLEFISGFILLIIWIWWIVNLFLVGKKASQTKFRKDYKSYAVIAI